MSKDHARERIRPICVKIKFTTCSRGAVGQFLKEEEEEEEEEYGEFDRSSGWTFKVHL